MSVGYVKLHRSLVNWEWWDDHNATRLLIYLLCSVNYKPNKWKGIPVSKGSMVTSFPKLSEGTGMSVKQVRLAMEKLEESGEVTRKAARKGQLVTLVKWEKLQKRDDEEAGIAADEGRDRGRKGATTKEGKKVKNPKKKENNDFDFKSSLLSLGVEEQVVSDWLKVRSKKNAANTETAFKVLKGEIEKCRVSANDCITEAVARSWTGFKAEWLENKKDEPKKPERNPNVRYNSMGDPIVGDSHLYRMHND